MTEHFLVPGGTRTPTSCRFETYGIINSVRHPGSTEPGASAFRLNRKDAGNSA